MVFTFTKNYLYAEVERILLFKPCSRTSGQCGNLIPLRSSIICRNRGGRLSTPFFLVTLLVYMSLIILSGGGGKEALLARQKKGTARLNFKIHVSLFHQYFIYFLKEIY